MTCEELLENLLENIDFKKRCSFPLRKVILQMFEPGLLRLIKTRPWNGAIIELELNKISDHVSALLKVEAEKNDIKLKI